MSRKIIRPGENFEFSLEPEPLTPEQLETNQKIEELKQLVRMHESVTLPPSEEYEGFVPDSDPWSRFGAWLVVVLMLAAFPTLMAGNYLFGWWKIGSWYYPINSDYTFLQFLYNVVLALSTCGLGLLSLFAGLLVIDSILKKANPGEGG